MALISAKTILTSLSLFHVTLAFFFFTSPETLADQPLVFMLGEAMGMPKATAFHTASPATSLVAAVLLLVGLSDLLTLSGPEEVWLVHHWGAQAPLRFLFFGAAAAAAFLGTPTVPSGPGRLTHPVPLAGAGTRGGWDGLRNRLFFVLAFVEAMAWFWAWITVREDTRALATRMRKRQSNTAERPF